MTPRKHNIGLLIALCGFLITMCGLVGVSAALHASTARAHD